MEKIDRSVGLFKALGDKTRLRIVESISDEDKSVNTIAMELDMTQSAISHQLKILKTHDIVKNQRKGKEVFYGLSDQHVKVMIEQVFNHTSHKHYE